MPGFPDKNYMKDGLAAKLFYDSCTSIELNS